MLFTEHAQAIIKSAKSIVVARNFSELMPEHIMLALMLDENDLPKILLERVGANNPEIVERLNSYLSRRAYSHRSKFSTVKLSPDCLAMMRLSQEEAEKYNDIQIGIEHLFLALFRNNNKVLDFLWEQSKINRLELYEKMADEVKHFETIEEPVNLDKSKLSKE